ncbi:MAG: mechanosensitive ion channel domain-containing protein, partial [Candidatus Altiarchaeota archaeon]
MKLDKIIKFDIPKPVDKDLFHEYFLRTDRAQNRIIVVTSVAAFILLLIPLGVRLNLLYLAESEIGLVSKLIMGLFVVTVIATFLKITTYLINRFFFFIEAESRNVILRTWNYGVWGVFIIAILAQFTGNTASLGVSIGVFSAGVAIALQQPIMSILGWSVIMSKRPYKVGDRILVRNIKGDVAEITLFHTVLLEVGREMGGDDPTGVKITLPNNIVLIEPVLNYTSDFPYIWDYIPVSVTYESDIKLAKELVRTAAEDVVGESMKRAVERMRPYLYGTPQETELTGGPVVYTSLSDSSV